MSLIKALSVGNGDMFYIKHGSSNFTIIDCNMDDEQRDKIVKEIKKEKQEKNITRFISTHPDEDHIRGLKYLDEEIDILNFYCVENEAIKEKETEDFKHYCKLRDGVHSYYVYKGCKRKWMNDNGEGEENYGSSGINFLWPITYNDSYKNALYKAKKGESYNNLSPIFTYSLNNGINSIWMGDMENSFMDKIKYEIDWPKVDILFAPHHGRESGKVPSEVLKILNPKIIVIGEAPSKYLNYYSEYNTITQNSAGNIIFENKNGKTNIYIENANYPYDTSFLENNNIEDCVLGNYLGTLIIEDK